VELAVDELQDCVALRLQVQRLVLDARFELAERDTGGLLGLENIHPSLAAGQHVPEGVRIES
jgi:hypothetical protein